MWLPPLSHTRLSNTNSTLSYEMATVLIKQRRYSADCKGWNLSSLLPQHDHNSGSSAFTVQCIAGQIGENTQGCMTRQCIIIQDEATIRTQMSEGAPLLLLARLLRLFLMGRGKKCFLCWNSTWTIPAPFMDDRSCHEALRINFAKNASQTPQPSLPTTTHLAILGRVAGFLLADFGDGGHRVVAVGVAVVGNLVLALARVGFACEGGPARSEG